MSKSMSAALLALPFLMPFAAAQDDPKQSEPKAKGILAVPATVEGRLDEKDPVDPARDQPAKTHRVQLKAGKTYIIDLMSDDFDAFLRLEDAKGKSLAEDDDGGEGENAQIVFAPERDGEYKIFASRFEEGGGNYTLKIRELTYKTAKEQAVPKEGLAIDSKLDNADPADPLGKNQHKVFSVRLEAGKTYTIDMASGDFDSFLRLLDSKFKVLATDDDSGGNVDARIVFEAKENGVYHIVATTFDGELGAFTLRVKAE